MAELPNASEIAGLVGILAPGAIILAIRNRAVGGVPPEFKDKVLMYGFVSGAYLAASTPIFNVPGGISLRPWVHQLLQSFIVPLVIGFILAYFTQFELEYKIARIFKLNLSHHIPTAWDYAFSKVTGGTFVLVTLSDGTTMRGLIGRNSFASSSREERDLLLEQVWSLDDSDNWVRTEPRRSVLICGKDVRFVEIYEA